MQLTAQIQLLPTSLHRTPLLDTMERCNAACNWVAAETFEQRIFNKHDIQRTFYDSIRERFKLKSQMAIRVIAKVADSFTLNKDTCPVFTPRGAISFDQRNLTFCNKDHINISTTYGRILIPYKVGDYHRKLLENKRGQSDLVLKKGRWYLYISVEVFEPSDAMLGPSDVLGVDLGIVNIAADSDRELFSGALVEAVRNRYQKLRDKLQSLNTRSARRKLAKLKGKEAAFVAYVNHVISKKLVAKAKSTGRVIGLEDLKGIRRRVTVRKKQRARIHRWAFHQLRLFILYKAKLAGVPVRFADPRNTSRRCPLPLCGYIDKRNRKTQDKFICKSCGFTEHADIVGACNVRHVIRRATVTWPIVRGVDRWNTGTSNQVPSRSPMDNFSAMRKAPGLDVFNV